MWCKHRIKRLADGSFIGSIATYMHPPYIRLINLLKLTLIILTLGMIMA